MDSEVSTTVRSALPMAATAAQQVGALYSEHAGFVWVMLQRLGVRASDLEDALQEVFVVVHRRIASYDPNAKLKSWLFGICLRVAAQFRRRAHVRREESVEEVPEPLERSDISPEEATLAAEARRELARVLNTLEDRKRVVFVMFEIDGLDCAAIGEQLELPLGTVHSRLHAARKAFAAAVRRERARRDKGP